MKWYLWVYRGFEYTDSRILRAEDSAHALCAACAIEYPNTDACRGFVMGPYPSEKAAMRAEHAVR